MSMRIFDGFKFTKLPTPVHQMDPRAKFILVMSIFAVCLIFSNPLVLLIVFFAQIPIIGVAKSLRRWSLSMKGGALLATLIFVMNFLTGTTLIYSLAMTVKFLALISCFSVFFMTTSPDDLGLALENIGMPFTLVFTFTTAVRLVPTMAVDAQTVIDAQRSRGLELEKGNFVKRIRNYIPILIPLIVSAIRRSIELAEALESRAFGASEKRESLVTLRMKLSDYLTATVALAFLTLSVYVYFYVRLPSFEVAFKLPSIWPWSYA